MELIKEISLRLFKVYIKSILLGVLLGALFLIVRYF